MPSSSSASARQARLALADQLRDVRVAAGLTGRDLAARAGWHGGSKVSKIEHGIRPPSSDDVRTWCQVTTCDIWLPHSSDNLVARWNTGPARAQSGHSRKKLAWLAGVGDVQMVPRPGARHEQDATLLLEILGMHERIFARGGHR